MKAFHISAALAAVLTSSVLVAAPLGSSITVSDGNYRTGTGWYGNHEDNETETNPDTVKGQQWDLEGMYLNGNALTLVGGFDFRNGTQLYGYTYKSGDIFIDVNGDAKFTQANNGGSGTSLSGPLNVANSFGYDYVIHFNSGLTSYDVFQLTPSSTVSRIMDVPASNPWRYVSGGTALAGFQNVSIGGYGVLGAQGTNTPLPSTLSTFGSTSVGLQGYNGNNTHYFLTVNTAFIPSQSFATFHYTIECGNDNLVGQARVPDGGSTLILLGGALALLFGFRRRFGL